MNETEPRTAEAELPKNWPNPTRSQPTESSPARQQTSVARSAGIVSIAVMFSRVLGLVREMVLPVISAPVF